MQNDVNAAESSSADEVVQQSAPEMESWSDAQRTDWLKTGEPPKNEGAEPSTASSDGEKPETGPESETGTQREAPKRNAEARIRQLVEENKRLREQQGAKPAAEPVQPVQTEKPTQQTPPAAQGRPVRPKSEEFNTYPEYEAAEDKYLEDLADWKADQRDKLKAQSQQEAEVAKSNQQRAESWKERQESFRTQTPDYDAAVAKADSEPCSVAMVEFMLDSEHGAALQYHLATHVEDLRRIAALAPLAQIKELTKIEASLESKTPAPTPTTKKPTTGASKPPTELSGRATAPEDEAASAIEAGDFDRYRRIMNARDRKK